jgi:Fe-S-cluster containining protein
MASEHPHPPPSVTAQVEFGTKEWHFRTKVTVPTSPTRLRQMLPLVQVLSDAMVGAVAQEAQRQGHAVSCKKGCGACCRQLVPLSQVEARYLRDLVARLPEPRRSQIQTRFAEALRRLAEVGLLEKIQGREQWTVAQTGTVGMEYFHQGIPCPFLEEESCSIHADRPIACREYLVTSPAENCAQPTAENVRSLEFPFKMWWALARFDPPAANNQFVPWVPLILALEWAEQHPEEEPARPGSELLGQIFQKLTGKDMPAAPRLMQ